MRPSGSVRYSRISSRTCSLSTIFGLSCAQCPLGNSAASSPNRSAAGRRNRRRRGGRPPLDRRLDYRHRHQRIDPVDRHHGDEAAERSNQAVSAHGVM